MKNLRNSVALVALLSALAACGQDKAPPTETVTTVDTAPQVADVNANFQSMAADHAQRLLNSSPELATELGVGDELGGDNYQARLGRYGFEAQQNARAMNESFLQELRAYDRAALPANAQLTYDVLKNAYEGAARRNQFPFGGASPVGGSLPNSGDSWAITPYFLTQLTGPQLHLPRMLQTQQPLENAADVEDYLARMEDFGRAFDEVIETIGADAAIGAAPPKFVIDGAANGARAFIASPPPENPLVTHLADKLAEINGMNGEAREAALTRATAAVENTVYPAYERLIAQLDAMAATADNDAGVWRLGEDGAAFYQFALDSYGAQGKNGDEVHEVGLAEVDRIHAELEPLLQEIDLRQGSVGARLQALADRPDNLYPNTDEGREDLLEALRGQVADIMAIAPNWFKTIPPQGVEVRRIPVHEQDTSPGGYYTAPSLDGSRPGAYWINLKSTTDNPKHSLKTLTYHEAVPGHHFSISSQRAMTDTPLMRQIMSYSEYDEGWALYGEKLAKEMGMYEGDPAGDIGRLQAELFRAARLVVDSGLHAKQWTREQAIDYMVEATGESRASVTREIERYAAIPGQATAYKLGMIAIGEMREKAEAELGEAFDIREFHDVVLTAGSVPMPVLSARVGDWIASKKN